MKNLFTKTKLFTLLSLTICLLFNGQAMANEYFSSEKVSTSGAEENTISINELTSHSYCPEDTMWVSYNITGSFDEENIFSVELSDANGDFDNAIVIGSYHSNEDGVIIAIIPETIEVGTAYRIRISSSNPGVIGEIYHEAIEIKNLPIASFTYETEWGFKAKFTSTSLFAETFLWDFGIGSTSTLENPEFTFPFDGTYPIKLTVTNQCGESEVTNNITFYINSINPTRLLLEIEIFPNPVSHFINLGFKNAQYKNYTLTLYNTLGQSVFSKQLNFHGENTISLDLSDIAKGMYFLHLQNEDKSVVRSVVKN